MKHIAKILAILVAITAFWISLLHTSIISQSQAWLLPVYLIITLGCYGLLMVGIGLMQFPTCPQEAVLLQQVIQKRPLCIAACMDIAEAKGFLRHNGVDVGSD